MKLTDWQTLEHAVIDDFADWWRARQAKEPEHFPTDMEPGEWDEQFRLWADVPPPEGE